MSRTLLGYIALAAVLAAGGVALAATGTSGRPNGGPVAVVAAENAYGSIAAQIGGRHVTVTSILRDPAADPHLFTADTATGLAVARAALVIQNGAGYDSFMGKLEDAAPSGDRVVVIVADVLGVHGADANPHLWYDVPRLDRVARAIAAGLEQADPRHRGAYGSGSHRCRTPRLSRRSRSRDPISTLITLNWKSPKFRAPGIRRALNAAIDRSEGESCATDLTVMQPRLLVSSHRRNWAFSDTVSKLVFDPQAAATLLRSGQEADIYVSRAD